MHVMRTPLLLAAVALLLTACGEGHPTGIEPTTRVPPAIAPGSSPPAALGWHGTGTSSGVHVEVGRPVVTADQVIGSDGRPDPAFRFVETPVTANNRTAERARLSFSGRAGTREAPWTASSGAPEAPPGRTAELTARFKVPADAEELVVEVYTTVGGAVTTNRLTFEGPLD